MAPIKTDAKKTMLAHSEAKVDFFQTYLSLYLQILSRASGIKTINIFDTFCGTGFYQNNKKGSPIVAFEEIKRLKSENPYSCNVTLTINDGMESKVTGVYDYLNSQNNPKVCEIEAHNMKADSMFEYLINRIGNQDYSHRNLIFIDPYGYKEVKKATIDKLLENGRSEIILFLPVSQMQRFTTKALEAEDAEYGPLREFIHSYFPEGHPLRTSKVSALEYIEFVTEAFKYEDRYFAASYYIERNNTSYYSLFFITKHIYGFEKILEVKWKLDDGQGRGFNQPVSQVSLFADSEKAEIQNRSFQKLENILRSVLIKEQNNRDIYLKTLKSGFRPTHTIQIFESWKKSNPRFHAIDIKTGKSAQGFYVNWDDYRKPPKVNFILK